MERPDNKSNKAAITEYLEAYQIDHDPESNKKELLALIPEGADPLPEATPEPAKVEEVVEVEQKGKYSKKELDKMSRGYFKRFGSISEIYACEDGSFFFLRHDAKGSKGVGAIVHKFKK